MTLGKLPHKIGTALKTLYCRLMNKTLDDLTPSIRSFCLVNPEADFEMIMDFVDSQIAPFEADDELCDLVMEIMLECDESNQST
ncbi:hypothetical protein Syn1_079 [Prochlorococcus phage Syn1]|uniref:Uncharacterized protein n=2 Tax=Vellamovirus TaxID=2733139 RepID=E3SPG4_9CAUD|nr:hypothetical protein Syn1_079 [Prochlorococcus phage Syn1]ADO99180.1 hypothetical protein Syn1_079 [Prochlorococcus phage Syn1]